MENKLSNPAPLGLTAFGMTTVLLNIHNAGFFPGPDNMIMAMGIFYGGIAQVIAGILEFRKGNTFGTTAFCSYGLFWITLVAIWLFPQTTFWSVAASPGGFIGWYLFMWGLFTFGMFFGTLKANRVLQFVFGSLTVLFWMLAIGHWMEGESAAVVIRVAGFEGILCGASAIYLAIAEVLEEQHGREILPIGKCQA
jgi:succinate-acetate transporter protein